MLYLLFPLSAPPISQRFVPVLTFFLCLSRASQSGIHPVVWGSAWEGWGLGRAKGLSVLQNNKGDALKPLVAWFPCSRFCD